MTGRINLLAVLGVFACLAPALAQQPFVDTERDHWAFEALDNLQKRGILQGYPDGHFRGKRTMTRYEFAAALDRALRNIAPTPGGQRGAPGEPGRAGQPGAMGPMGPIGPAGMTPPEIETFRRLVAQFKQELAGLGQSMAAANRRLDALARDIADVRAQIARMPRISGDVWMGMRSDMAHGTYVDADGRFTPLTGQQFPRYNLMLNIDAALPGGAPMQMSRATRTYAEGGGGGESPLVVRGGDVNLLDTFSNYRHSNINADMIRDLPLPGDRTNMLRNSFVINRPASESGGGWSGAPASSPAITGPRVSAGIAVTNLKEFYSGSFSTILPFKDNPSGDAFLHHLNIRAPFNPIGTNGEITIGRFGQRISPLTLWKPDIDSYFNDPLSRSGNFQMDGLRFNTNWRGFEFQAFAAKFSSVRATSGPAFNSPLAGVRQTPFWGQPLFFFGDKPSGQNPGFFGDAVVADGIIGWNLQHNNIPIPGTQGGRLRFTDFQLGGHGESGFGMPMGGFTNVKTLGADADIRFNDRFNFTADWAKTITGTGRFQTVNPHFNNAFNAGVNYNSGGLCIGAGYRYIDPLFYAPGYWGKIGNWLNPTNVAGPTFRAAYDFSPAFRINLGGDFFSAARDRAMSPVSGVGGLGRDDSITRVLAGLRWDVSKNFRTTLDWEGVYWTLDGPHDGIPGLTGRVHPFEHYLRFTTGYNLTNSTQLRLGYEKGDFNGKGALDSGGLSRYSGGIFTTELRVRF